MHLPIALLVLVALPACVRTGKLETFELNSDSYKASNSLPFDQPVLFLGTSKKDEKAENVLVYARESDELDPKPFLNTYIDGPKEGWKKVAEAVVDGASYYHLFDGFAPNKLHQVAFVSVRHVQTDAIRSLSVSESLKEYRRLGSRLSPLPPTFDVAESMRALQSSITKEKNVKRVAKEGAWRKSVTQLLGALKQRYDRLEETNRDWGGSGKMESASLVKELIALGNHSALAEVIDNCVKEGYPEAVTLIARIESVGAGVLANSLSVADSSLIRPSRKDYMTIADFQEVMAAKEVEGRTVNAQRSSEAMRQLIQYFDIRHSCWGKGLTDGDAKAARDMAHSVWRRFRDLEQSLTATGEALTIVERATAGVAKSFGQENFSTTNIIGSSTADMKTTAGWHVAPEGGFMIAHNLPYPLLHFGLNLHVVPVNRSAEYQHCALQRVSITIGATASSVKEEGVRDDLVASRAGLFGVGYRVAGPLRAAVGVVLFKREDRNPSIDDKSLTLTPYVSVSYDWDLSGTLGKLASIF